jgi:predicted N-acetyltransferase YhbS
MPNLRSVGTFLVRPARPEEFAAVGALTANAYRVDGLLDAHDDPVDDSYELQLLDAARRAREAELWVAADADGTILGTVTWCPVGSPWRQLAWADTQAEFRMLSVAPAGRRRGVARALVQACLDRGRQDGMTEVVLWSHPLMLGAHALYTQLGFTRAHELDGSPAPKVHLWGFRRAL